MYCHLKFFSLRPRSQMLLVELNGDGDIDEDFLTVFLGGS